MKVQCETRRMTQLVRTAVVGLGYFGSFHARHYALNRDAELVAVVDADAERAAAAASVHGAQALADHRDLFGKVDAVSIAAPTIAQPLVEGAAANNRIGSRNLATFFMAVLLVRGGPLISDC